MTLQEFRDAVRYETGNELDSQYDDTMLDRWLFLSYQKLYRRVSAAVPGLFTTTSSNIAVTSNQLLAKPTRFKSPERIEVLINGQWLSVPHASKTHPEQDGYLGWSEQGSNFVITPAGAAPGTYRIVYVQGPHATAFQPTEVTEGFEDVIVQWSAAKARGRMEEANQHQKAGDAALAEQLAALKAGRRGSAPEPGMVFGYGSGSMYDEELP